MIRRVLREIGSLLLYFALALCLTWLLITFVGQRTQVQGTSMEPTLNDGDNLIVDKISYRFREPRRFEIVIFPSPYEEDRLYIKRIIGMPGETVYIGEDGTIYIDGEVLTESYGKQVISSDNRGLAGENIVLGEEEYFVLGDNRNNSSDSRFIGNIKRENIIGRAWLRIWPFEDFGILS